MRKIIIITWILWVILTIGVIARAAGPDIMRAQPAIDTKVPVTYEKFDSIPPAPDVVTRPVMSEAVHWSVNNADTVFGKSLTGWSTMKLDSEFKPLHIKVGIISGRMGVLNEITREEYRRFGILEEWHRTSTNTVFGIHFVKEF